MCLGFEFMLDLVSNKMPKNLVSLDMSGNQLSQAQVYLIQNCLGVKESNLDYHKNYYI